MKHRAFALFGVAASGEATGELGLDDKDQALVFPQREAAKQAALEMNRKIARSGSRAFWEVVPVTVEVGGA